jgi:hypothetical protein
VFSWQRENLYRGQETDVATKLVAVLEITRPSRIWGICVPGWMTYLRPTHTKWENGALGSRVPVCA